MINVIVVCEKVNDPSIAKGIMAEIYKVCAKSAAAKAIQLAYEPLTRETEDSDDSERMLVVGLDKLAARIKTRIRSMDQNFKPVASRLDPILRSVGLEVKIFGQPVVNNRPQRRKGAELKFVATVTIRPG